MQTIVNILTQHTDLHTRIKDALQGLGSGNDNFPHLRPHLSNMHTPKKNWWMPNLTQGSKFINLNVSVAYAKISCQIWPGVHTFEAAYYLQDRCAGMGLVFHSPPSAKHASEASIHQWYVFVELYISAATGKCNKWEPWNPDFRANRLKWLHKT